MVNMILVDEFIDKMLFYLKDAIINLKLAPKNSCFNILGKDFIKLDIKYIHVINESHTYVEQMKLSGNKKAFKKYFDYILMNKILNPFDIYISEIEKSNKTIYSGGQKSWNNIFYVLKSIYLCEKQFISTFLNFFQ